jgi:hypothetical protein
MPGQAKRKVRGEEKWTPISQIHFGGRCHRLVVNLAGRDCTQEKFDSCKPKEGEGGLLVYST